MGLLSPTKTHVRGLDLECQKVTIIIICILYIIRHKTTSYQEALTSFGFLGGTKSGLAYEG